MGRKIIAILFSILAPAAMLAALLFFTDAQSKAARLVVQPEPVSIEMGLEEARGQVSQAYPVEQIQDHLVSSLDGLRTTGWDSIFAFPPAGEGVVGEVYAMAADGEGNIYVGGEIYQVGDVTAYNVARWDGSAWHALIDSVEGWNGVAGIVNAITIDPDTGDVYVGGSLYRIDGDGAGPAICQVARWSAAEERWFELQGSVGNAGVTEGVRALAVYNGKLYVGGAIGGAAPTEGCENYSISSPGIVAWNIAAEEWESVGGGVSGGSSVSGSADVYALVPFADVLALGGIFDTAGAVPANNIAFWAETSRSSFFGAFGAGFDGVVNTLAVYNGDLYAGGFTESVGFPYYRSAKIEFWDGTDWNAFDVPPQSTYPECSAEVMSLAVHSATLVLGGYFDDPGLRIAGTTNGAAWETYDDGIGPIPASCSQMGSRRVLALASAGGYLYAGGQFESASGLDSYAIARYSSAAAPEGVDLDLTKTVLPLTPEVYRPMTYTLVVENQGTAPANGVRLTDTLPVTTPLYSLSSSAGFCNDEGEYIECFLGTILPSEVVTVEVFATPMATGTVTNEAEVTAEEADINPANNTAVVGSVVQQPAAPVLSIQKGNQVGTVIPGAANSYTYKISVTHNAWIDLPGIVTVADVLPPEFVVTGYSAGGIYSSTINTIAWVGNSIVANQTLVLEVTGYYSPTPSSGSAVTNTALASMPYHPIITAEDVDTLASYLTIEKTNNQLTQTVGSLTTYTITVGNVTALTLANITVVDYLPQGLVPVVYSPNGVVGTYNDLKTVFWLFQSIPPSGTQVYTVTAYAQGPFGPTDVLTNVASASMASPSLLVYASDVDELINLKLGNRVWHDLDENGWDDAQGPREPGIPEVEVELWRDIEPGGLFNPNEDEYLETTFTDGNGYYTFTRLAPGSFYVVITHTNFAQNQPLYLKTSTTGNGVSAPDPDDDVNLDDNGDQLLLDLAASQSVTLAPYTEPVDDGDTDNHTNFSVDFGFRLATTDLVVTKTAAASLVSPGETVVYTITIANQGTDASGAIEVTDIFTPLANLAGIPQPGTQGCFSGTGPYPGYGQWYCILQSLNPGQTQTLTYSLTTSGTGVLINGVIALPVYSDTNSANNTDLFTLTIDLPTVCPVGGILYVDADRAVSGDGSSWGTAFKYLQDALRVAPPCEIWVAEGLYYPDEGLEQTNDSPTATFALTSGLALYGGFAGTETERSQRDWNANPTILSGDLQQNDASTATGVIINPTLIVEPNAYHVARAENANATAVLDGFILTGGAAFGLARSACGAACGGGLHLVNSSPTLANLFFSGNTALNAGGGVYLYQSSPVISNTLASNNWANNGGGLANDGGSPALTAVTFLANTVTQDGGGLWNSAGAPSLVNVQFLSNVAFVNGGGLANLAGGTLALAGGSFSANQAGFEGGGMYNFASSPVLTGTTFSSNEADLNGGGLYINSADLVLTNTIFTSNQADLSGGGVYQNGGDIRAAGTAFSGNSGDSGGGLFAIGSDLELLNASFVENNAAGPGGALYLEDGRLALSGGLVMSNTANHGAGLFVETSPFTLTQTELKYNAAFNDGGGVFVGLNSTAVFSGVDVFSNTAKHGGGIVLASGTLAMSDSAVQGNQATHSEGGGIAANANTSLSLQGSTVQSNQAAGRGGGIYAGQGVSLTFRDGTVQSNQSGTQGGGIYLHENAVLTLADSLVQSNAASNGGGLYFEDSGGTISATQILTNTAYNGGGIYLYQSSPTLTGVNISGNASTDRGGGIYGYIYASPVISGGLFANNTAGFGGGLAFSFNSSAALTQVTLRGNQATLGGGMHLDESAPTLTSVVFDSNEANNGGGLALEDSAPVFSNVTFLQNTAQNWGGGLLTELTNFTLQGAAFTGNHAEVSGGGVYIQSGAVVITNTHLEGNTADYQGGGIYQGAWEPGSLSNSALLSNTAGEGGGVYLASSARGLSIFNSDFQGNAAHLGGGLYAAASSAAQTPVIYIEHSRFQGNEAEYAPSRAALNATSTYTYGLGGGIYNISNTLTLTGSQFIRNYAQVAGGGVYALDSQVLLTATLFQGSSAIKGAGVYAQGADLSAASAEFLENVGTSGGGLYAVDSQLALTGTQFIQNWQLNPVWGAGGAGMYLQDSQAALTNTLFAENETQGIGGGVYVLTSTLSFENATFRENQAYSGGALVSRAASLSLNQASFFSNTAALDGGALYVFAGDLHVANSLFKGNAVSGIGEGGAFNLRETRGLVEGTQFVENHSPYTGGAIYQDETHLGIAGSVFLENSAGYGGALAQSFTSTVSITSTHFLGNAAKWGGALLLGGTSGTDSLTNLLFVGNQAEEYGGAIFTSRPVRLTNSTLAGNHAAIGGGLYLTGTVASLVQNSILWGNTASAHSAQVYAGGASSTFRYSLLQDAFLGGAWNLAYGTDGGDNLDANPLFIQNPNAGGDGWADDPNTPADEAANNTYGDLRLRVCSPAINQADRWVAFPGGLFTALVLTDLNSAPRLVYGGLDMGAYEFQDIGPVACGDAFDLLETQSIIASLGTNDLFTGTYTITHLAQPAAGTLTALDPYGVFQYSAQGAFPGLLAGQSQVVTFTYLLQDSTALTDTAVVSLTVNGVDDDTEIGGRAWFDGNQDGLQDSGEPGLANLWVHLYDALTNQLVASVQTQSDPDPDVNGVYHFGGLPSGQYWLEFERPTGYLFTTRNAGVDDALDSDADPAGATAGFTLAYGETTFDWDAGLLQPVLSIDSISVNEGNSGLADALFQVTLALAHLDPVTVTYTAADGTAVSGLDYLPASGQLVFAPGETHQTITVQTVGDTEVEGHEFFTVTLSAPQNAMLAQPLGYGTILDDDGVEVSLDLTATITESTGTTRWLALFAYLSQPSLTAITVTYTTTDALQNPAAAGVDYTPVSGTFVFTPGSLMQSVLIGITGDSEKETPEQFLLQLTSVTGQNAYLGNAATAITIFDDDGAVCPAGGVLYVDKDVPVSGTGASWGTALKYLQSALNVDQPCEIWVAEGVYYPDEGFEQTNNSPTATFALTGGLSIYGGFVATETLRTQRDSDNHPTILSGDLAQDDVTTGGITYAPGDIVGTNADHVVTAQNVVSATLDGFIVTGGSAPVSRSAANGGGLLAQDANLTLGAVGFVGNQASGDGGGLYFASATGLHQLVLTQFGFIGNHAQGAGGGLMAHSGQVSLTFGQAAFNTAANGGAIYQGMGSLALLDVLMNSNAASANGGGVYLSGRFTISATGFLSNTAHTGGGLYTHNAAGEMTAVTFKENTAAQSGGGYAAYRTPFTGTQLTFENNQAKLGGGLFNEEGAPTLTGAVFTGNQASINGGGLYNYVSSSPTLTGLLLEGNHAGESGGGMFNFLNSHPVISATELVSNTAKRGAGMLNHESNPSLHNVVVRGNQASIDGGGIYNDNNSRPALFDVTLAANQAATNGGAMFNWSTSPTLYNVQVLGNQAAYGAGLYNYSAANPVLVNSLVAGNRATFSGGGLYSSGTSQPVLTNVTLAGNAAGHLGGGLFSVDSSQPVVQNSIIWGNTAVNGGNVNNLSSAAPTFTHSLVQGCHPGGVWSSACGTDGGSNLPDVAPLFSAPAAASSAPTTTGDYTLQAGSPAANLGDNAADLDGSGPLTDTIGSRPVDLSGNPRLAFTTIDLGAYELQTFSVACPAGGALYVDADNPGPQNGHTWASAFNSLQDALLVGAPCEIWVAEGVYYPDEGIGQTNDSLTATFALTDGLSIYGGFAATETLRTQRNWEQNLTILSGDLAQDDDLSNADGNHVSEVYTDTVGVNAYHVVVGSGAAPTAVLDGFTITGGDANGVVVGICGPECGGGMLNEGGSPTLANLVFSGNRAKYAGGGMYNNNGSHPQMTNVTFIGNYASSGGGLANRYNQSMLIGVQFINNRAELLGGGLDNGPSSTPVISDALFLGNQAGVYGGGMFNSSFSEPHLTGVRFENNQAGNAGGGIANMYNGKLVAEQAAFTGNQAQSGAGIYNDTSSLVLTQTTFTVNHASANGGGIANRNSASVVVSDSEFRNNQADVNGGGLYNEQSQASIVNSSFRGNQAGFGGGIANQFDTVGEFINVLLSGNQASFVGGGMYSDGADNLELVNITASGNQAQAGGGIYNNVAGMNVRNVIVWDNSAATGANLYNNFSTLAIFTSLIGGCNPGGTWNSDCGANFGPNLVDGDPYFAAPVPAANAPTTAGDYRLLPGSSAVNVGSNTANPTSLDLAGNPRLAFTTIDLGAYELQTFSVACPAGGILYVDEDATGANNGTSWANAFVKLQDALQVSGPCQVWVAEGIYYPDEGIGQTHNSPTATFAITSGVKVFGGFNGTETLLSQQNTTLNKTILSGDIDQNDLTHSGLVTDTANINGTNAYHVVTTSGADDTARLDSVYITGGSATGTARAAQGQGGGLYNLSGSPVLTDLYFYGNRALSKGGGLYNENGQFDLLNLYFMYNSAQSGGGMYNLGGSGEFDLLDFRENTAERGGGLYNENASPEVSVGFFKENDAEYGGGMYNDAGSPALSSTTFSGNQAASRGGGMASDGFGGVPTLAEVDFLDNQAEVGGGMLISNSGAALTNVSFFRNHATFGGGLTIDSGSAALTNVSFVGNQADKHGGGMQNYTSTPSLTNVSFTGNDAAEHGGGLYNYAGSHALLTNVTFSGNQAGGQGGGMYNYTSSPQVQNSILWGNAAAAGPQVYNLLAPGISPASFKYSLIEGCNPGGVWNSACGTDGGNNLPDADPLFVAPVSAASAPTTTGDYHLEALSPAINAGNSAANSHPTDLDGNPRIYGGQIDLGASEFARPVVFFTLYLDNNADGYYQAGSDTFSISPGVVVELLQNGNVVQNEMLSGSRAALVVPTAGDYTLRFVPPTGLLHSPYRSLALGQYPSGLFPATSTSPVFTVGTGFEQVFAGVYQPAVSVPYNPAAGGSLNYTNPLGGQTGLFIPAAAPRAAAESLTLALTSLDDQGSFALALGDEAGFAPTAPYTVTGHSFVFDAFQDGAQQPDYTLPTPGTLTIQYTDEEVQGLDESTLRLFYWDEAQSAWVDPSLACGAHPAQAVNASQNTFTAGLCSAGRYALFGIAGPTVVQFQIFLPLVNR